VAAPIVARSTNRRSANYGRSVSVSIASSPEAKESSVAPTVPEQVPDRSATARPESLGYEWPSPIRQLRAAFRGHLYRQNALLALCVLLLGLAPQTGKQPDPWDVTPLLLASSVVQSAALIWRRKAPFSVYCVVLVSCIVQWAAAQSSGSNVSLMICLYTLARYWPLRRLPLAIGASVPSLFVLAFRVKQYNQPQDLGAELLTLFFLSTALAASIALGLVARERHAQLAALAERAAHAEFEREQQARIAVLAERAGFSREMHDIVGHSLAVIIGLADGGVRQVEARPERGRQAFELIGETGRQALADLRRTLGALRERPLDEGGAGSEGIEGIEGISAETLTPQPGVADISELLERTRSAGPRVSYRTGGEPASLPRSLQLAIYRIVQESLTNSLKHAGPDTNVQVAIEAGEESLQVSVADTGSATHRTAPVAPGLGSGPGSGQGPNFAGHGLTGVRERAALAGGRTEAGPNDVGGWTVTARFPLNPPERP
jgi:signal transduction histidine kinase